MLARLGFYICPLISIVGTAVVHATDVPALVQKVKPAVVEILTFNQQNSLLKSGTSFFISPDGILLTNYHVISGGSWVMAKTPTGAVYVLKSIVFTSEPYDIAELQFFVTDVPYLTLGSSSGAVEGQRVLVIGNPYGLEGTLSDGIISAFRAGRTIIQITAPISAGSSGSPVLDESGQVIGIATLSRAEGQNLNLAIAVETLKTALLANNESGKSATPARPWPSAQSAQRPNLNKLVKEFVTSGNTGSSGTEISFYADEVDYFDNGKVTKPFIVEDISKYNQRWPERRYWTNGEPSIEIVDSSRDVARAVVTIGFAVQNHHTTEPCGHLGS